MRRFIREVRSAHILNGLNGLFYFVRSGCAWRLLPREFGSWETVYGCFRTWRRQGLWKFIHEVLRRIVRRQAGKRSQPTAAILDSQTVRSADHGGPRGYDAGKKIKGHAVKQLQSIKAEL